MTLALIGLALADTGYECPDGGTLRGAYCHYEVEWEYPRDPGPFKCGAGSDHGWADYAYASDGGEYIDLDDHEGFWSGSFMEFVGGSCLCEGTKVSMLTWNDWEGTCFAPTRTWPEPVDTGRCGGGPQGSAALLLFGGVLFWRRR